MKEKKTFFNQDLTAVAVFIVMRSPFIEGNVMNGKTILTIVLQKFSEPFFPTGGLLHNELCSHTL